MYVFNLKYACVSPMHTNRQLEMTRRMFLLTKGKCASIELNVRREVVLNLFRDSRTLLDSVRDKLVTLIYFAIVQFPSVGTTWYRASLLFQIPLQLIIVKIRK